MVSVLGWLEQTGLSLWVREEPTLWSFPFVLFLHTLGLGVAAGLAVALNIWVLGFASRYPAAPLERFFAGAWLGFALALVSGTLLLIAYPTKALTDPVFYAKLLLIVAALGQLAWLRRRLVEGADSRLPASPSARLKLSASVALACWAGAVLTGRLLAYTYVYLMSADMLRD